VYGNNAATCPELLLSWVRGVIDDLRAGRLTWSEEWLREMAATFLNEQTEVEER
jgi:hypothetical protein